MNVTYRRPRRKSMLGTRLSILHDNIELSHTDVQPQPSQEIKEPKPSYEAKPINDIRVTRSSQSHQDTESFTQVLTNIEILLQKNSQTLKTLLQEREQLEKIELMLKDKINSSKLEFKASKENQPPVDDSPTKFKSSSSKGSNPYDQNTPSELCSVREGDRNDEFVAPENPAIDTMRSSIKFLKTPRPSRQARKSIMLTPHSFSFSIHKQFESLKE